MQLCRVGRAWPEVSAPSETPVSSSVKSDHYPKSEILNVSAWLEKKLAVSSIVDVGNKPQ